MSETKKQIPKRRFKGFKNAGAWEQCKLYEFSIYNTSSLSIGDAKAEGKYKLYDANKLIGYTNENAQTKDYITIIKDGSGVGRVRLLPKNSSFIGTMGAILTNGSDINFLYSYLENTDYSKHINGATIPHVYYRDYGNDDYFIPALAEQAKIGLYFKSLNNFITLHQRKLEKIKSMKKAYLYEMFPAEGKNRPKRRFKGFTDNWELLKVGEIGTVQTCKRIFKEQTNISGDIPFYKNGTLGLLADSYISKDVFNEFKKLYPFPEIGDILMSVVGSIGRTVEYMGDDKYFQDSNIVWLKTNKSKINRKFLKISYQIIDWIIEGSTIKHLYNDNILLSKIWLPSISEQEQIGVFFTKLDNLITLHQHKLDKLRNLKKSYLNEMLI